MPGPLEGLLVIALEQAVAAPFCTLRLADAGARVIKLERPQGDFEFVLIHEVLPVYPADQQQPGTQFTTKNQGRGRD